MRKILILIFLLNFQTLFSEALPGLWLASIEVNKVNELHSKSVDKETPTTVMYPFNLQLLLHMNERGDVNLLKEAYLMQTKEEPLTRVIVVNDKKLSNYQGIIRKGDNKLAAVRFSTPSFDFTTSSNIFPLEGFISSDEDTVISSNDILHSAEHPTNPFRHQFHPNHKEGFKIKRDFQIMITANDDTPSANVTKLKGTYMETVIGIHKQRIRATGSVQLIRVSSIDTLIE